MKQLQIFLSARYSRREELKIIRQQLQNGRYIVVSRWLDTDWNETERDAIYSSAAPPERREEYSILDVEDVRACDVFVAFTEEPRSSSRGGRHVETGIAIGMHKPIIVVGPQENIFYHLPKMLHLPKVGIEGIGLLLNCLDAVQTRTLIDPFKGKKMGSKAYDPF